MSVLRALAGAGEFECVLGVNPGFTQRRTPSLAAMEFPRIDGEIIGAKTFWRARVVARVAQRWLAVDHTRIFHAHSRAGLLTALWLARAGERRVVASVHCYGRQRWFYRWAARRLDGRLYWLSPAMKRYYGVAGSGSWEQCIPACVSATAPSNSSRPRDRTRRPVRLGGAGLVVEWKRWHLMLEALALLPPTVREQLRFVHIGGPDESAASRRYAAALRARTIALGLSNVVEWRGEQPSSQALLTEIDCAVVLSRLEPFSMVMIEALAAGVPVVASAAGGPRDVLMPSVNGWLFEPGDPRDLARVLTMLVETDALRCVRIEAEQLRPFTAPVVAEQWARVYAALSVTRPGQ